MNNFFLVIVPSEKIKDRLEGLMPEYRNIFGIKEEEEEDPAPAKKVKLIDDQEMDLLVKTRKVINSFHFF